MIVVAAGIVAAVGAVVMIVSARDPEASGEMEEQDFFED